MLYEELKPFTSEDDVPEEGGKIETPSEGGEGEGEKAEESEEEV